MLEVHPIGIFSIYIEDLWINSNSDQIKQIFINLINKLHRSKKYGGFGLGLSIVPADIQFKQLHKVLQSAFEWRNYHLYDFTVFDKDKNNMTTRIVPFEEDLEYDKEAILMESHTLSEFLSEDKYIIYTYDMVDNWKHEIQLINVIDEYDKEAPYLLEESGKTPPEDVGGVPGFINFREIMMNPNSPEYKEMREWAGFWTVELSAWEKRPRVINI